MTQPRKIKNCKHHDDVEFVKDTAGRWRCTKCRVEAVSKARRNRKRKLVEYFGGQCIECGYDKCMAALHFHHNDPHSKEFGLAFRGYCKSWKKMLEEAKKCSLLCSNCHYELHNNLNE